jgi:prevent-host-death family protein
MKTVSVSTLKATLSEQLRHVKHGERVTVLERGRSIAMLVPMPARGTEDERLDGLVDDGIVRAPLAALPEGFFDEALPVSDGAALSDAVRQERDEGW